MILKGRKGDTYNLAFGSPKSALDKHQIFLSILEFWATLENNEFIPLSSESDGSPKCELIDSVLISNNRKIDPATKQFTETETGIPAFTFFTSRTVGDIYTDEQIEAMNTAQIRAISRYNMDAQDIEEFILANGYVTGTRI